MRLRFVYSLSNGSARLMKDKLKMGLTVISGLKNSATKSAALTKAG